MHGIFDQNNFVDRYNYTALDICNFNSLFDHIDIFIHFFIANTGRINYKDCTILDEVVKTVNSHLYNPFNGARYLWMKEETKITCSTVEFFHCQKQFDYPHRHGYSRS